MRRMPQNSGLEKRMWEETFESVKYHTLEATYTHTGADNNGVHDPATRRRTFGPVQASKSTVISVHNWPTSLSQGQTLFGPEACTFSDNIALLRIQPTVPLAS